MNQQMLAQDATVLRVESSTVGESLTRRVDQRLGRGLCALGSGGVCLCFLELFGVGGSVGVGLARCLARLPTLERRTTCTAQPVKS